jgi:ABC-type nickel/cobalt efflux system permease component RcnA
MTNIDIAYLVAYVAFIVISIIQLKINREQQKINKAMSDYIHASNKDFDRIEEILKEGIILSEMD